MSTEQSFAASEGEWDYGEGSLPFWDGRDDEYQPSEPLTYVRAAGEYWRPDHAVDLTALTSGPTAEHAVAGIYFHRRRPPMRVGQRVTLEMVPEPGHPIDPYAVALDYKQVRVGYMRTEMARHWHDVIAAMNQQGLRVTVPAVVRDDEGWDWDDWEGDEHDIDDEEAVPPGLHYQLPTWDAMHQLERQFGLVDQARTLLASLPPRMREYVSSTAYCWTQWDRTVRRSILARAELAPGLNWGGRNLARPSLPPVLGTAAIAMHGEYMERRRQERTALQQAHARGRAARDEAARLARLEKQERAEMERVTAATMRAEGATVRQIAEQLGRATGTVETWLRKAGAVDPDHNETQRRERIGRAQAAVQMQAAGLARSQIATELGLGMEAVKQLLADGRFYTDPPSNPSRLGLALQARTLQRQGLTSAQVHSELGVSAVQSTRAVRDASALEELG